MLNLTAIIFIVFAIAINECLKRRRRRGLPLPPGPRGLPIIGTFGEVAPKDKKSWLHYIEWSNNTKSDLIYFQAFGRSVVVVNSARVAIDLFEKRSRNYSDRPTLPMVNDLMKWHWNMANIRYSDWWRLHRRAFQQAFQLKAVPRYYPVHHKCMNQALKSLLKSPNAFAAHLRHLAGSVTLQIAYAYEIQPENDFYIELAEEGVAGLSQALNPGSFLVDFLPFLKYVPEWMPGASFKRKAKEWAKASLALRDRPFDRVKEAMAAGNAKPCYVTETLGRLDKTTWSPEMEEVLRDCAGIAFLAGADTTVSAMITFVLAMVLHPSIQDRAQAEIDAVIGNHRLPDYDDRGSLPYVEAIFYEVLRWQPVIPLGVPHSNLYDDIYDGYFIPSGSTIIGNAWAILRDPNLYPDPSAFKPERFLQRESGELNPDPTRWCFGFGRRICPGRYLAMNSLWLTIASILSTFTITKTNDDAGNEIIPDVDYCDGTVSHPSAFQCSILPRSSQAIDLINAGYVEEPTA